MLKDGQQKLLRIDEVVFIFSLFNSITLMKHTGGKKQGLIEPWWHWPQELCSLEGAITSEIKV